MWGEGTGRVKLSEHVLHVVRVRDDDTRDLHSCVSQSTCVGDVPERKRTAASDGRGKVVGHEGCQGGGIVEM